ncbi:MAG: hypothetical protein V7661_08880 [Sulfitobacter sp.]
MIDFTRRAYNLRRPDCDALQPVVGLSSTLRSGLFSVALNSVALNSIAPCVSCGRDLKLVHRHGLTATILARAGMAALGLAFFLTAFVPAVFGSFSALGLWGLLVLPFLILLMSLFGLLLVRIFSSYYREVIVI